MSAPDPYPRIRTVGLEGLLVSFAPALTDAANRAAIAFCKAVDAQDWPEVTESASTMVSAFFRIDLVAHDPALLVARLQDILSRQDWMQAQDFSGARAWTIPAVFGTAQAPQLAEFAGLAGIDEATAKRDLLSARLRVLTLGFAPGTPYLGGMPAHWNVPRQTELSRRVPRGALVAAIQQVILFSKASPTGWRHVGQTAFHGFQPTSPVPIPLRTGDVLSFAEVSEAELAKIEASGDPMGGAECVDFA